MRGNFKDLTGKKFGKLLVVSLTERRTPAGKRLWECRCDCGGTAFAPSSDLNSGHTTSCGCNVSQHMKRVVTNRIANGENVRHGHCVEGFSATYQAWRNMINRCELPSDKYYPQYGGRGIQICQRWRSSFELFLADMGEAPEGYTIERRDRNGHYEPGNCCWADRKTQANNRSSNRLLTFDGVTLTAAQWAERLGIAPSLIYKRLRLGWTDADALTRPVRRKAA